MGPSVLVFRGGRLTSSLGGADDVRIKHSGERRRRDSHGHADARGLASRLPPRPRQGRRVYWSVSGLPGRAPGESSATSARRVGANNHPILQFRRKSAVHDGLANVRSLSVKFQLPGGKSADILANSIEGFVARTPEELLEFLRARLRPQALWPGDGEFAESHARIHPC